MTLNESYTTTVKPFPSRKGDTADIKQVVDLRFPAGTEPGEYNVIGEMVDARVKVLSVSMEVTKYLPQKQGMGKVRYGSPPPKPAPAPAPAPAPVPPPSPSTTPRPPSEGVPWWVWLTAVSILTTVFNVIYFLKRRAG